MDLAAPSIGLEAMERGFAWSGRKSAMALAARMSREMINQPEKLEAEWETADRLGYSDAVVRQARRILQDFGIVQCQRGRKGALWTAPATVGLAARATPKDFIAPGVTTMPLTEPKTREFASVTVTDWLPAVLRARPLVNLWTPASVALKV